MNQEANSDYLSNIIGIALMSSWTNYEAGSITYTEHGYVKEDVSSVHII